MTDAEASTAVFGAPGEGKVAFENPVLKGLHGCHRLILVPANSDLSHERIGQ